MDNKPHHSKCWLTLFFIHITSSYNKAIVFAYRYEICWDIFTKSFGICNCTKEHDPWKSTKIIIGASQPKTKDFLLRYMSWGCFSSFPEEFSTARFMFEEWDPEALEKILAATSRTSTPRASACYIARILTKFCSAGSSKFCNRLPWSIQKIHLKEK